MARKKHPILLVIGILCAVVLVLVIVMSVVLSLTGPSKGLSFGNRIGVISIEGMIVNPEPFLKQLVEFKKDGRIKAIILRINSPGGAVGPSQEIYREVRKTIKTKKVIASMSTLAASGGYYIAAAADKIVANPGTISGSIGVIMEFVQVEDLLGKLGIGLEVVKSGEFKDIGSPHRKMSSRDREIVEGLTQEVRNQFVEAVATGRNLPVEAVREIADGRILTGARCKELGLVDSLGNFMDAVDLAKEMVGIEGEVTLVHAKKKAKSMLWELFFDEGAESLYQAIRNFLQTKVEYRWDGALK
ncbi:MAG: signal peptide peptidase SppA [Deltaproteobacteria bacterium HGW-Deltaproteobacteria-15]|jgi:protease-4|nr:MAG: signal peptide peptidase SppA [Deltaproteobacteria bacterium HGW-Deltaproteobacteria-15]